MIEGGKAIKKAKGRVDYVLRVKVNSDPQPVAGALIEAKLIGCSSPLKKVPRTSRLSTERGAAGRKRNLFT